jgi:hypothetical protein
MAEIPRRAFLVGLPGGILAVGTAFGAADEQEREPAGGIVHDAFPAQDPTLVQKIVGVSHFDIDAVRELITARPALARASWDWGFGDWESALGAASHVGRHDIVELLMAHGARPDLFTLAMLDQVDAVRAVVEATPGVQRLHGPHGITLLAHARFGKAKRVVDYLEGVGGADDAQTNEPLDAEAKQRYVGKYAFGRGADGTLTILEMNNGMLGLRRRDEFPRQLLYASEHTFHPPGVPSVRISFRMPDAGPAQGLTVHDGDLVVTALRS